MEEASFLYDAVHLACSEQIGLHRQSSWELSYVLQGAGERQIGRVTEPFEQGEVVLLPPAIPHCWHFDAASADAEGKIANITLTFGEELLKRAASAFPELRVALTSLRAQQAALLLGKHKAREAAVLLERMQQESPSQRTATVLQLLLLLAEAVDDAATTRYAVPTDAQERLERLRVYVACNYQRRITLAQAAQHIGLSRAALCLFYKRQTGQTFFESLNTFRLRAACRLLGSTALSVADICYQTGFNDVPYFNRQFKRCFGLSPSQYRQHKK